MESSLWMEGVYFPPFSARGCHQELSPIPLPAYMFQRTIKGDLIFLGDESALKYRTIIQCKDKQAPIFSHKSKGGAMRVGCIQHLSQPLNVWDDHLKSWKAYLKRPYVLGSIKLFHGGKRLKNFTIRDQMVLSSEPLDGMYVLYRPILHMRLMDFHVFHEEWDQETGWRFILEEI